MAIYFKEIRMLSGYFESFWKRLFRGFIYWSYSPFAIRRNYFGELNVVQYSGIPIVIYGVIEHFYEWNIAVDYYSY